MKAANRKSLSPTQLALQMRARRTKRMVLYNLYLLGVIILLGGSYYAWSVLHEGKRFESPFAPHADTSTADVHTDASTADPAAAAVAPTPPSSSPLRKFVFICDMTAATHPRVTTFLAGALSGFGKQQSVDVLELSPDGRFVSVTGGPRPMSPQSQQNACKAVGLAPDSEQTSILQAMQWAINEEPEAVYLLTSADKIHQLGNDPLAAVTRWTSGRKLQVNCVIFPTETDAPADLTAFKKLADGTHGAYTYMPTGD